jgi:hypothetical protein
MKISWSYKIVFIYTVFVLGILTMVFLSAKENRDLVSENYYADEIAYQQVIDQSSKTAALSAPVELIASGKQLIIQLPKEFYGLQANGEWTLYYAADKARDLTGNISTQNGKYSIVIPAHAKGQYLFKMLWKVDSKEYYFEQNIFLQP